MDGLSGYFSGPEWSVLVTKLGQHGVQAGGVGEPLSPGAEDALFRSSLELKVYKLT